MDLSDQTFKKKKNIKIPKNRTLKNKKRKVILYVFSYLSDTDI